MVRASGSPSPGTALSTNNKAKGKQASEHRTPTASCLTTVSFTSTDPPDLNFQNSYSLPNNETLTPPRTLQRTCTTASHADQDAETVPAHTAGTTPLEQSAVASTKLNTAPHGPAAAPRHLARRVETQVRRVLFRGSLRTTARSRGPRCSTGEHLHGLCPAHPESYSE